jgi:hypothetical protein
VGVDEFDDGHGRQQEKQDFGHAAEVVAQFADDLVGRVGAEEHVDCPAQHAGEQGRGRFVEADGFFEGNQPVAEGEDGDERGNQGNWELMLTGKSKETE